jgi:hypothetical protein
MDYNKKFVVVGSKNAITYKEIFMLIRDNRLWLGYGFRNGNAYFQVPNPRDFADGVYDEKTGLVKFRNCAWFTNLDVATRHEKLMLFKRYSPESFLRYDNYDAINVNKISEIPYDYVGIMGVPITFTDNYNPEQFEIIGLAAGNIRGLAGIESSTGKDGPYIGGKLKYGRILIRNRGVEQ